MDIIDLRVGRMIEQYLLPVLSHSNPRPETSERRLTAYVGTAK